MTSMLVRRRMPISHPQQALNYAGTVSAKYTNPVFDSGGYRYVSTSSRSLVGSCLEVPDTINHSVYTYNRTAPSSRAGDRSFAEAAIHMGCWRLAISNRGPQRIQMIV